MYNKNLIKTIECKFSSYALQEKNFNQIKSFKNKFKESQIFIVSYDYEDALKDKLNTLCKNKSDDYKNIFNLISIEKLSETNPFKLERRF